MMNDPTNLGPDNGPTAPLPAVRNGNDPTSVVLDDRRVASSQPKLAITPVRLWHCLWYRRWLAVLVGVVLAGAGAALAWYLESPRYTAVALLRVVSSERLLPNAEEGRNFQWEEEFRKTQVHLVKSRKLLQKVLSRDSIGSFSLWRDKIEPVAWLEKELQSSFIKDTDILRIALTGEDPKEITDVVNAIKEEFCEESEKTERYQQAARVGEVEKICIATEEKIRGLREKLRGLAETMKTADSAVLTLKQRLLLEEYGAMKKELSTIQSEIRKLEAQYAVQQIALSGYSHNPGFVPRILAPAFKDAAPPEIPAAFVNETLEQDPVVQKLTADVNRLQTTIQEYAKIVKSSSPRLAEYAQELKVAEANLEKARAERRPHAVEKLRAALTKQRERALIETEEKLQTLKGQEHAVEQQAKTLDQDAERIGTGSVELELRRAELDQAYGVLKRLGAERERLTIEAQRNNARIRPLQDAEVPQVNQANLVKSIIGYSISGLLLGLFAVAYGEARSRRVHKPSEVRAELGIETLGMLPLASRTAGRVYGQRHDVASGPRALTTLHDGQFAESVDSLRNTMLCDERLNGHSVIMVTSSGQHEGKTFLSTHLAASLARVGRKTLLLDCDLRKPSIHHRVGVAAGPGLCEVLRGEVDLAQAIQTVPGTDLAVLTAGNMDAQVTCALSNGQFRSLLDQLREQFDSVVLDSAPTLIVSDTLLIGKQVDAVILVVRPQVSRAPLVYSAFEQMRGLNIRVLGAVINAVSPQRGSPYQYAHYSA